MLRRLTVILIAGILAIAGLLAYSGGIDQPAPDVPPIDAGSGPATAAPQAPSPVDPAMPGLPSGPGPTAEVAAIVRVVDGDTLVVDRGNGDERVRLVGVDTPETVQPNAPVECFGRAAHGRHRRTTRPRVQALAI